jgi:hypothetical protein
MDITMVLPTIVAVGALVFMIYIAVKEWQKVVKYWYLFAIGFAGAIVGAIATFGAFTSLAGELQSSGGELGTWTMSVDQCESGEPKGFFGVDLYTSDDERLGVRIIDDPVHGIQVNVNIPESDNRAVPLRPGDCAVLDAQVYQQNKRTNWIWHMAGSLRIDCETKGGRLLGEVEFEDCY